MKKRSVIINKDNAVISIRGLCKSFDTVDVLMGMDLDLFKGENVVVLGRSGSGKSVLIKLIAGLLKPDKGTVKVTGEEVSRLNVKELEHLRLKIGFLYQGSALYDSMTVKENLEFPLVRNKRHLTRKEIDEEINQVLENVGLLQSINQMPAALSGGQKKRIGIARTLILQPEIMLYDEPTAGLDPVTCGDIITLINDVQQKYNTSSVIITHDLTCAKYTGDRVALIADGKFRKEGTFEEVFTTSDPEAKSFYDYNFIIDK
ncbi:phospholipid/cholesterol/gamma-HCH transport system ATP-binding protein [Chitinophaga dinghuensis]|uniref:Phospholipid/cholesterol/gamma-HCH transport system ATP-binding protein n=1 Tax=Chitinophaga dinghuensis TaxID=1539050 RepID=A0A327VPV7_9BACT|nr:ATP-binding cassette domain-containing protein [Chitinophaga dinghuensis]RAJ77271.1 phospholipid/cholesterol/gamma-HCH transport system ATP-binding protein [Chitinophaga dinghuensis]